MPLFDCCILSAQDHVSGADAITPDRTSILSAAVKPNIQHGRICKLRLRGRLLGCRTHRVLPPRGACNIQTGSS
jgi:hypothetical protein